MVYTNQKPILDTQTQKKKESKHNTKDSNQITREQKRKKKTKNIYENNLKTIGNKNIHINNYHK